jgi:hypothetical protein
MLQQMRMPHGRMKKALMETMRSGGLLVDQRIPVYDPPRSWSQAQQCESLFSEYSLEV